MNTTETKPKIIRLLYKPEMVRAYLAGTKTQTRRTYGLEEINSEPDKWVRYGDNGDTWHFQDIRTGNIKWIKCPYGQSGDVMLGRESVTVVGHNLICYNADGQNRTVEPEHAEECEKLWLSERRSRLSIHMFDWMARIRSPILSVRPERLQDITEADAIAEGIEVVGELCGTHLYRHYTEPQINWADPRHSYMTLWNSINGPDSWDSNPWCWVVEFERHAE